VFPEDLPETIDEAGLDFRDAALAHAILENTLRHWTAIEYLASGFLSRPFTAAEPAVRAVLLGGVAQLIALDRVPTHAAIDTAVEWVKQGARPASGLVNAVLRRIGELVRHGPDGRTVNRSSWSGARDELPSTDGGALVLARPVLPEFPVGRIAVATSHPAWLISRWSDHFGRDAAVALAHHSLARPPLVLTTEHARSPLTSPGLSPHDQAGSTVAEMPHGDLLALLSARSDVWVQDPSAALAVRSVADVRPHLVVDLCAGRGTKARQLAMTFPDAQVLACDPDPERARVLASLQRHYPNLRVDSPQAVRRAVSGRADLVLLDVPCSNSGALARRVAAKHRSSPEQLARLVAIQRSIVHDARALLAPGGLILYSTCSLEPEENTYLVRSTRDLALSTLSERLTIPGGLPGGRPGAYRDGSFSALLRA